MKKIAILRSLGVIGLSWALFACSSSSDSALKKQASETWDSAGKTVEIAGKDTGNAISSGVKSTDTYIDDSAITADIKSKLLSTSGIPSNSVSVKTVNGVVYLSGFIKSSDTINQITQIAASAKGVKSVQNGLVLTNK
ncbi:Osmotically-inducible protein Y precursor [Providencia rustigianii]|uniref:Phospholipid-binding domain protein n=2 Tax=Providencia rustigianii TaxID=158850 RepID=D1P6H7_9GAMM|nr:MULTISPECIES: BON domain-containing protein [Providencia]EFB71019.1 phospholipid-binding domain protein [Providencia rustigianii DSM 4541]MTC58080.1 BON domain-containing protein [Providencia rustigianii]MTC61273.1 BON domain-containing protein [Providencia rustigianii]SPY76501.1 Osmotically-inducible protein Y precursor [Providencia rustigianii]SUC25712.1 Osmotically-inducible protein Y precursor [Providencia rustigianii]